MFDNIFIKPLIISVISLSICYLIDKQNNKSNKNVNIKMNKYIGLFICTYFITFMVSICYNNNDTKNKIIKTVRQSGGGGEDCPF